MFKRFFNKSHIIREYRVGFYEKLLKESKECPQQKVNQALQANRTLKSIWFILLFLSTPQLLTLPAPYDSVNPVLPYNSHGWNHNVHQLSQLFNKIKPKIVVEVGVWIGASAISMASLLPQDGKLYAVDHFLGSSEHQPGQVAYLPFLPYLYEQFLSNVIHKGLTDKIIPVKMNSLEASEYLKGKHVDFIYIDASHDYESVYADLKAWYPFIQGHGVLTGDDYDWTGVHAAVNKFAVENGLKVIALSSAFWYLQEPN